MEFIPLKKGDLELQLLNSKDAEDIFRLTEKNRTYLREFLPWLDTVNTLQDTKDYIAEVEDDFENEKRIQLSIRYLGNIVGVIGFHKIDWKNKKTSIGYWIDRDHQGKGIVTEATKLILEYGFTTLGLNRIVIKASVNNQKSQAVAKRLGFIQEGTLREVQWLYDHFEDHKIFSMLAKDWKK